MIKKSVATILVCLGLLIPPAWAAIDDWTEDFEGPCAPYDCGAGAGAGRGDETMYTFYSGFFRNNDTSEYWADSAHQASGGVNDSAYFRAVFEAGGTPPVMESYLMIRTHAPGVGFADNSFYHRLARRFSSGWSSSVELKLFYHYAQGVGVSRSTLFWSSDQPRLFLTDQNFYVTYNQNNTKGAHTHPFYISQYSGKWWAYTYWFDWSSTTSKYKLWITTEDGAANCDPGTVCDVAGKDEFNNFLYMDTELSGGTIYTSERIDLGFYLNNNAAVSDKATADFDSFKASESVISSNPFSNGGGGIETVEIIEGTFQGTVP